MARSLPLDLRSIRLARRGAIRVLRALFLALAVIALLPVGDVLGAARSEGQPTIEVVADGCADDCAGGCADHGCTPTSHHCPCCAPAATVPGGAVPPADVVAHTLIRPRWAHPARRAPWRGLEPPTRPPIA